MGKWDYKKHKKSKRKWFNSAIKIKPDLGQDKLKPTWIEYCLSLLVASFAGIWTFSYVGIAIEWDDLWYMNVSQYTTPQAWVMHRYGHIYLQKFFFWLANDAITGTKIYWCFIFFGTVVLVYWCARILAGKRGYIIGLIAVLLFCAQTIMLRTAGSTQADFTVMFLVMLATFIYLAFLNHRGRYRYIVIMLLGLIFFWTVKSKETGICMAVLFLGLGRNQVNAFSKKRFVQDIGWVFVGMLIGLVLLMTLDLFFIQDALFSIRPSNIIQVLNSNLRHPHSINIRGHQNDPVMSYYTCLSLDPRFASLFAPFLLYLLVGWKAPNQRFSAKRRIAWLFPMTLLLFLSLIRMKFVALPRYFAPAIPCICVWAAQFFQFRIRNLLLWGRSYTSTLKTLILSALIAVAFIIVYIFTHQIPRIVEFYGLTGDVLTCYRATGSNLFYMAGLMPFSITILFMVSTISKKRGLLALFLSSLCLFLLTYPPLEDNLNVLKQKVLVKRGQWRYEPYRVFAEHLRFDTDTKILISKEIYKRSRMLGRSRPGHQWMFNVVFNQNFDEEQFIDGRWEDIVKGDYTYAFLTLRDWEGVSTKYDIQHLLKVYEVKTDKKAVYRIRSGPMQLILLKKRCSYQFPENISM